MVTETFVKVTLKLFKWKQKQHQDTNVFFKCNVNSFYVIVNISGCKSFNRSKTSLMEEWLKIQTILYMSACFCIYLERQMPNERPLEMSQRSRRRYEWMNRTSAEIRLCKNHYHRVIAFTPVDLPKRMTVMFAELNGLWFPCLLTDLVL